MGGRCDGKKLKKIFPQKPKKKKKKFKKNSISLNSNGLMDIYDLGIFMGWKINFIIHSSDWDRLISL